MDEVIARIKDYAIQLNSTLGETANEELLDFVVNDVVERAMIFMNRDKKVVQYEEDLETYPMDDTDNDAYWSCYSYPIPPKLERTLAGIVLGSFRTIKARNQATMGKVTSVSDHGQEVRFSDKQDSFLNSNDDSDIFSGSETLLRRYLLPKTLDNPRRL